jgi:hypothetical protein
MACSLYFDSFYLRRFSLLYQLGLHFIAHPTLQITAPFSDSKLNLLLINKVLYFLHNSARTAPERCSSRQNHNVPGTAINLSLVLL